MSSLAGQRALITGGATGIGYGIAAALGAAGCHVAIAARREDKLRDAAARWTAPQPLVWRAVDVANRESVAALFAWSQDALGPLDLLVCSAGMNIKNRSLLEMRPEQWDEVMAVNATGVYNCLYYALPSMRERRSGQVFIISSVSGKRAAPLGGVAYNASKFAATGLGTSAWSEEGPRGVRITNVYPGEVDTPILEHRPEPVSAERRATMLQPEDLGQLIVGLAQLPPRAHVPEVVIKPTVQSYV